MNVFAVWSSVTGISIVSLGSEQLFDFSVAREVEA
jgi:hypothetical protein